MLKIMYTIEQLRNGEVACINDGTLEQIIAVLKHTFPEDAYDYYRFKFEYSSCSSFCKNNHYDYAWLQTFTDAQKALPTQSVIEFYKQIKPQFEVGSWYYSNDNQKLFIKVKTILKDGFTNDSEVIWSSGIYQDNNDCRDNIKLWTKLEDLSEIQQYLPDNHSDKIKIMNKQYLTRKQLIELHKANNCKEWKISIADILEENLLSLNDDKIEIYSKYIDLANSKCSDEQKKLLINAGLKLFDKIAVCDSKDGDCIKVSNKEYYVNRNNIVSVLTINAYQELQLRYSCLAKEISPDIKGELITNPLTLQIKINLYDNIPKYINRRK